MNFKYPTVFLIFAFLLLSASSVYAWQGVAVRNGGVTLSGFGEVNPDKTVDHWKDREKSKIEPRMKLQIELMQTVCELNSSQVKKLRIAVKGVVSKRISAGGDQIKDFLFASGLIQRNDDAEKPQETQHDDVLKTYGIRKSEKDIVEISTYFVRPLMELPLWQSTLKKTLTATQFEKFRAYLLDRNRSFVAMAADTAISKLDTEIFLSQAQREEITKHVYSQLVEEVTMNKPRSVNQASSMYRKRFRDADEFKEFLTDNQIKHLETVLTNKDASTTRWGSPPNR